MRKSYVFPILLALLCLSVVGCSSVRKANYDKIRYGMTLTEVEAILGKPAELAEFDAAELSLEKIRAYKWEYLARVERFADTCVIKIWGTKHKYVQVLFMGDQAIAKRQEGL